MTEGQPDNPFDLEQLRHVLEMMEKHELTDLKLAQWERALAFAPWRPRGSGCDLCPAAGR